MKRTRWIDSNSHFHYKSVNFNWPMVFIIINMSLGICHRLWWEMKSIIIYLGETKKKLKKLRAEFSFKQTNIYKIRLTDLTFHTWILNFFYLKVKLQWPKVFLLEKKKISNELVLMKLSQRVHQLKWNIIPAPMDVDVLISYFHH